MSGFIHYPEEMIISPINENDGPQDALCRTMYHRWSSQGADASFSSADLIQWPDVLPLAAILDYEADSRDFRFKFVGQTIVQITGRDLTGKLVLTSDVTAPLTREFCEEILKSPLPLISKGAYTVTKDGYHYQFDETIALPILNSDNELSCFILVHGLSR